MPTPFVPDDRARLLNDYFAAAASVDSALAGRADGATDLADPAFAEQLHRSLQLIDEYRRGVPSLALSRCPFTGSELVHSFDPYGLDGLWWRSDSPVRPEEQLPATFVQLSGAVRLAEPIEYAPFVASPGPEAPFVLPALLAHEDVRAVISSVPVGGHRGFITAYFADHEPVGLRPFNAWGVRRWSVVDADGRHLVAAHEPQPSDMDFDLEPWLHSGKLMWIAPGDPRLRLRAVVGDCPYLELDGSRSAVHVIGGRRVAGAPA